MALVDSLCPGVFDSRTVGWSLLLPLRFPSGPLSDSSPSLLTSESLRTPSWVLFSPPLMLPWCSLPSHSQRFIITLNSLKPVPPAHQFPELWILGPFCLLYLPALRYLTHLCSVVMCQTLF